MNERIRTMMGEIEQRGGTLYVNPRLPDELVEQFLAEVLACPDCTARTGHEAAGFGLRATGIPFARTEFDAQLRRDPGVNH